MYPRSNHRAPDMPLLAPTPELELDVPKGASAVSHTVVSFRDTTRIAREDQLAVEEPLEIRLGGKSLAVTMRTPGRRRRARRGLPPLGARDREGRRHRRHRPLHRSRRRPADRERDQRPAEPARPRVHERLRRNFFTSSSCGLCGKVTIDAIDTELVPVAGDVRCPRGLYALGPALAAAQATFERTGRPPRRRALRCRRPARRRARGHRAPQRGGQGHRPHAARGPRCRSIATS